MPTIFYSKDAQFEVSQDELKIALTEWNQGHSVYINRLNVSLSPHYLWADDPPPNKNLGRLHDSTLVEKQFGRWVDMRNPEVRLDPHYYPEIANDTVELIGKKLTIGY